MITSSGESGANFGKDTFQISPNCNYIAYFTSLPTDESFKNYDGSSGWDIVITEFTIEDPYNYKKWIFSIPQVPIDHFSYKWVSETEISLNEDQNRARILYNADNEEFIMEKY